MDNLLEIKGLTIGFCDNEGVWRNAVEDVTLGVRRGSVLGIVGESGSGKSVTSLAVMGLLPDAKRCRIEGSIRLDVEGEAVELVGAAEERLRRLRGSRMAMVFQEPMTSLNPVKRCGAQVEEMLRLHEQVDREESRRRVLQLFEEVMLPRPEKIFDSYPHEISGGQKQRVMIAMALICNPDLLIADEPTTALDVTVQKTILELLRKLQRERGISVIFISHDLGVIANVADDVAVMYRGHVVEMGAVSQILHSPAMPYTKGLLACRPPVSGRPARLLTVEDFMNEGAQAVCADERAPVAADKRGETPLLSVRGLDVTYALEKNLWGRPTKELKAVDGVSFDVYRGETLGLVGESGCGKTTLGRAILRLVDSASGSVTFDGQRLDRLSAAAMRRLRPRIQIIFQDPYSSLNPRLTVGQAIMEPMANYGKEGGVEGRRAKALRLMERVGLRREWFDRYPHEFSGGQRQRVCIARALSLDPELVVCDESVSALDVSVQAQVLNLLNELKEECGYTYIFISHDLSVVHFLSDRIMVMRGGRLVELNGSDELFANPQEEYTRALLAAIPRVESERELRVES